MSSDYKLLISNPSAASQDIHNAAYINAQGGNELDLTLTMKSGSTDIITIDSNKNALLLKISREALSPNNIRTDGSWNVIPAPDDGDMSCFRLMRVSGNDVFKAENPLAITLVGVQANPAVTAGKAEQVILEYSADGEAILSAGYYLFIFPCTPQTGVTNPLLIGADGLLTLSVLMNGRAGNPLIVSPAPTTADNCLKNTIKVNMVYQGPGTTDDTYPAKPPTSWDDNTRPTLKIYFPYTGQAQFVPDALCLTDTLQTGAPGFNKLTAAGQIVYSLMPPSGDPDHTNTAWKIEMASDRSSAVWTLTPLNDNSTCLFTKGEAPGDPGPILNVFFSQVVSNLPILEEYPQTLLYLDWKNFPGYTDGMLAYSVRKEQLSITDFTGTIHLDDSSTKIFFDWQTVNADYCTITGDSAFQQPNPQTPCVETITALLPMQSDYTLTAVGKGGVSATSTIGIDWKVNADSLNQAFTFPHTIFVRPGEDELIVLDNGQIYFLNMDGAKLHTISGNNYSAIQMTQDGRTLFAMGQNGTVSAFETNSFQLIGSMVTGSSAQCGMLAANTAGTIVACLFYSPGVPQTGCPIIMDAATMKPVANQPKFSSAYCTVAIGPQTGRYYLATADHIDVLDPVTFRPVSGSPIPIKNAENIAFSADETKVVYVLSDMNPNAILSKVDGTKLTVVNSVSANNAWPVLFEGLDVAPPNILMLSPDGSKLFLAGATGKGLGPTPVFSVFDTDSLLQSPWEIGAVPNFPVFGLALAPKSWRIFTVFNGLGRGAGIYSIDAEFSAKV